MPVFAVEDLDATVRDLTARGWQADGPAFEIPNGTCYVFSDPAGNPFAILQNDRPNTLEKAYEDPANTSAIHD